MPKNKEATSQALAVKYRPRTLEGLVGQDSVATQIHGMLNKNVFPATMLLAGESGSGKTTTARMIARYINCESPAEDHTPCGECSSCKYEKSHPDVHELNMAEDGRVEAVRDMVKSANSMPTLGRKRIFLLDEIQAATPQSFQVLLKPLEEPPAHTMWLLCTTNPEKLSVPILGRCHKFVIRPLSEEVIVKRLRIIGKKEGVDFKEMKGGPDILSSIANMANGRMRDSIAMLESVLFAIASKKEFTSKELIQQFAKTAEADLEVACAKFLMSVLKLDTKQTIKVVMETKNCRGILNKTRWLVHGLLQSSLGLQFFRTYAFKNFAALAQKESIKVNFNRLVLLQNELCNIEQQFNTLNIDEVVLMTSRIGTFISQQKAITEK